MHGNQFIGHLVCWLASWWIFFGTVYLMGRLRAAHEAKLVARDKRFKDYLTSIHTDIERRRLERKLARARKRMPPMPEGETRIEYVTAPMPPLADYRGVFALNLATSISFLPQRRSFYRGDDIG